MKNCVNKISNLVFCPGYLEWWLNSTLLFVWYSVCNIWEVVSSCEGLLVHVRGGYSWPVLTSADQCGRTLHIVCTYTIVHVYVHMYTCTCTCTCAYLFVFLGRQNKENWISDTGKKELKWIHVIIIGQLEVEISCEFS